jgi:hypothetical protein
LVEFSFSPEAKHIRLQTNYLLLLAIARINIYSSYLVKRLFFLCSFLLCAGPTYAFAGASSTDSLLAELNQALAQTKEYDGQRLNRIAVLTADFASSEVNDNTKFDLGLRIYDEYKAFKYDSAFVYCQKSSTWPSSSKAPKK